MATVVKSMSVEGIEGFEVEIEATTIRGQQQMISVIGLGDQAVKEAAERIQAALEHDGFDIPKDKTIISLAPGNRRKRGSHYDLGMTIALLQQTQQIAAKDLDQYVLIGELSLNGRLRPCNGILSMISEAKKQGIPSAIVPYENCLEAKTISGINVYGFKNLREVVRFIEGKEISQMNVLQASVVEQEGSKELDFRDVKGQNDLITSIVLAAAGGHNILMIGEPGCGKTMIAQRISTILPEMSEEEALAVTKIHSISGLLRNGQSLMVQRPFRAPHHNISLNALIGGGTYAQPGEVSLAHNGVLFLDELAEFSKSTLDALRQPLEDKQVTIARVNGINTYPANFMFVAAMNPCPCGYYPSSRCKCTDYEIMHYRGKISGPILERIDIQKNVKHVNYFELSGETSAPSSAELRDKVKLARKIQQKRFQNSPQIYCNAQMPTAMIQKYCALDEESTRLLREASEKYGYSARVIHKLMRLARTAADLAGEEKIRQKFLQLVLKCRDLDRSNSEMYVIK